MEADDLLAFAELTMTDLEMTLMCAEAMGYEASEVQQDTDFSGEYKDTVLEVEGEDYDPLHDDSQAMALVKKLELSIGRNQGVEWDVENRHTEFGNRYVCVMNKDLNRAIVECVAKAQKAK